MENIKILLMVGIANVKSVIFTWRIYAGVATNSAMMIDLLTVVLLVNLADFNHLKIENAHYS